MKTAMSNAKPFFPNKMDFPSLEDSETNSTEDNSPITSCQSDSPKKFSEVSAFQQESNGPPEESLRTENQYRNQW